MRRKIPGGSQIRAVILAAGKGRRLRPLTQKLPKALVPIGGAPLIDILIDTYQKAGVASFTVGIGWQGDLLRKHLHKTHSELNIDMVPVPNYEDGPLTTLVTALKTVEDDCVIVGPVDEIMDRKLVTEALEDLQDKKLPEDIMLVTDPSVEKGTEVFLKKDDLVAGLGMPITEYDFKARSAMLMIISKDAYSRLIESSKSGMRNLSDALNYLIDNGVQVGSLQVEEQWFDIDTVEDMLQANQYVLHHMRESADTAILILSGDSMEFGETLTLPGDVFIERGVSLEGPVLIQKNSHIQGNTQIGPDVVVGKGTRIGAGCSIDNAVLFHQAKLNTHMKLQGGVVYGSEILYAED
ncbi:MAG: sugar phosphate nucleotidyltransferase [Promethearchaeia archaeon]